MASLRVLTFDHGGRPVQFDTWLDDLQLYLPSDSKESVSLFDLASGAATAPPAIAVSTTRSQWLTRDAAARLAIRNHLPLVECAHFGQRWIAQVLYDAVVARYSSPATAALGRLLLPYLFPEQSTFTTVEDLVSHLRASDARYRAAVPAEDHFLSLDPTSLTVDLLEHHLLVAETSAVAVGAARGTPRPPFFEGCSPSPLAPSYASAAAADVFVSEDVGAASASAKHRSSKGKGGRGGGGGSGGGGGGSGSGGGCSSGAGGGGGTVGGSGSSGGSGGGSGGSGGSGGGGTGSGRTGARRVGSRGGQRQQQQHRSETPSPQQLREIAIFDLDFDAILSAMSALSVSAEGDCYRCVPPDPGIAAAALGASESGTLPGTARAAALHTFTLDSGASRCFFHDSTTLTPLPAPVLVRLADPSRGLVMARSSTILPCPAVPSGSLSGLHLPSFSTNLVSTAALRDAMVTTTTLGGQRVSICTCTRTGRHLATFTHRPWSSLYTLTTEPSQVAASAQVSASARVSGQSRERYFLLVVDDYTRYTTVFPLRSKGQDLPVVRLHSDRGGEFSSNLLRDFFHGEGILQSFTLPDSPQQNGISKRRIGLVMEVACTSMIHAAAPHFLWPFAVRYAAHQLNLWPRVSLPETSPTLRWTGEVGDASVFRVWGSHAFVRDTSADKISPRAIPCVFLGFVPDALGWQFYHPNLRRVFPSQDVTFDKSVPFYCLFPYRSAPPPPPPLFLAPGPPPVAVDSGAAQGATSGGAEPGGAESEGAETGGAEHGGVETGGAGPGGAETGGAEPGGVAPGGGEPEGVHPGGAAPGGAESEGAESGGAEPQRAASSGGSAGASPSLSPQQLREWFVRRPRLRSGASGAGGAGGTGVAAGAGVTGGTATTGPGGARTRGTGDAETRGLGGPGVGGSGAGGAGVVDPGGTVQPRPYFVPLLQQSGGITKRREIASRPVSPVRTARRDPRSCPPPVPSTHAMTLRPSSTPLRVPLPAPPESSLPESTAASALAAELLDFAAACRLDYVIALVAESTSASPPSVGGKCALSTDVLEDRQEDFECLAAAVPHFASMLLVPKGDPDAPLRRDNELHSLDFSTVFLQGSLHKEIWLRRPPGFTESFLAGTQWSLRRPVYGLRKAPREWHDTLRTTLAALGFAPANAHPSLFLRTDTSLPPFYVLVYVDDLVFATADTEALTLVKSELQKRHSCTDLGELRSYLGLQITRDRARRTITLTQSHMVHQVLQRFGFQFSSPQPTPLSTSHSLSVPPSDESVEPSGLYPELVGCLITSGMGLVLGGRGPVVLTGHADASWAPREWHDTLRTTLVALGFAPSTADPSLFLRTDTTLPPFYILVPGELRSSLGLQITRDTARRIITLTQSHMVQQVLQRFNFTYSSPEATPPSTRHSLSALPSDESVEPSGPTSGMGLALGGRARVVLTGHANSSWVEDLATLRLSQGYTFCLCSGSVSWRSTRSSSVLSSSCEAEIYAGAMAAQELRWLTYLLTNLGEAPRSPPVLYVDNKAMLALCHKHRLEHRTKHIALCYFLARELHQRGQLRLAYVATRANTADIFTKALQPCDH
ncbi:unnamed protein product [Closterium sp. NIES-54]